MSRSIRTRTTAEHRGNFNAQLSKRSEISVAGGYTDRRLRSPFNGSFFQGIQIQGLRHPDSARHSTATPRSFSATSCRCSSPKRNAA